MDAPEIIGARFALDVETLGLDRPPVPLRARLSQAGEHWALSLVPPRQTHAGPIVDWLASAGRMRLEIEPSGLLLAHIIRLPAAWARLFQGVEVETMSLDPDGHADLAVRGPRAKVQRFAMRLLAIEDGVAITSLRPAPPERRMLTAAQEEALREAVEAGYYKIPRPLNLHELAQRLGITAASLSERLRRAEARILTKYVEDAGSAGEGPEGVER
ncbi:MAG: hypothetical protein QOE90_2151 [Thermoplasmata archaeon]|nr:hypothetical protein [Thermoplasmata archaeon]